MPTYEYACSKCGHRVEVTQRIDDPPLTACERCGGQLRKVFHPAGIVFKGSGFYATDSRSKPAAEKRKADAKGKTQAGGASGAETGETKKPGSKGAEGKKST